MALARAPRLILFDEPAAGLSPAERRELVALLRALPAHIGFILIEHDLDIALRVVDRVVRGLPLPAWSSADSLPTPRGSAACAPILRGAILVGSRDTWVSRTAGAPGRGRKRRARK